MPVLRSHSPWASRSSVGNGPAPTRVVYAFSIPMTLVIRVGPMAEPDAGAARGRRGRRHERVRSVVHVEQRGLGALEQQGLALVQRLVQHQPGVGRVGPQPLAVGHVLLGDGLRLDTAAIVDLGQDLVLLAQHELELLPQDAGVEQILHPDPHPGDLVAVGRPDAAAGGADPGAAQVALGHLVQRPVVRHDQVRVGRDQQPLAGDPPGLQAVDLLEQHLGVDHDAVADDRGHLRREHPGRQQVQRVAVVADDHRVPGVVPALVADHVVNLVAEQVGCLALAFVAPLGADEHDGRHLGQPLPEA